MPTNPAARRGDVSDAAVRAATGRRWAEWFAELDAAAAARMKAFWRAAVARLKVLLEV
jgi:hypothetical protein